MCHGALALLHHRSNPAPSPLTPLACPGLDSETRSTVLCLLRYPERQARGLRGPQLLPRPHLQEAEGGGLSGSVMDVLLGVGQQDLQLLLSDRVGLDLLQEDGHTLWDGTGR